MRREKRLQSAERIPKAGEDRLPDLLSYDWRVENASFSFSNSHGATQASAQPRRQGAGPTVPSVLLGPTLHSASQCWAVTAVFGSLFTVDLGRVLSFIEQSANSRNWKNKTSLSVSLLVLKDSAAGSANEERCYFQKPFSPGSNCMLHSFLVID